MRGVTAETQTWLAARYFLLERSDDFYLQMARSRETFDPEAIHDLRVSTRRLLEGIAIFGHCFRKSQLTTLRNELKGVISMLGSIRNMDEAILFFTHLAEKSAGTCAPALLHLLTVLNTRRSEELRKLKKELKKIDPEQLLGRIDAICKNPRIFNPNAGGLFRPVAECILDAVAARGKSMLSLLPDALIEENVTTQHRLRIAVKRFRYRVEYLAPIASNDYKSVYSVIKEFQEVLGRLHDLDVFRGIAKETILEQPQLDSVEKSIADCRKLLFAGFLRLQTTDPLDEIGRRVRGLL